VVLAGPLAAVSFSRLLNIPKKRVDCRLELLHSALSILLSSVSSVRLLQVLFRDFLADTNKRETNLFWVDSSQEGFAFRNGKRVRISLLRE
jgi:hypothetical protein